MPLIETIVTGRMSSQSRFVKLGLFILFTTPAMTCALYFMYYVLKIPSFRKRFQNQTLIILVVIVFFNTIFNIPTTLSYLVRGSVLPKSEAFCHTWQCIDYIFTACIIWCEAIFTLERYILVFHPNHFRSDRKKLIFHYIPLVFINLYLILFYLFSTLFYHCNHVSNFNEILCGGQCLDLDGHLSTFNWLFNILFPVFIIIFGSLLLLIRVLWTRREMQRNLRNWSKNWKMIVQLLGFSVMYTIVWLPLAILTLADRSSGHEHHIDTFADYLYFLTYLCELGVPIVALFLSPEIMSTFNQSLQPGITRVGFITNAPDSTH